MNFERTIEGHNHVVYVLCDRSSVLLQQQARAQYGCACAQLTDAPGEPEKIAVHERLAPGEDDPLDPEHLQFRRVAIQLFRADLLHGVRFPDVAHDAAAIATAVRTQNQNGQPFDLSWKLSCQI